MGGIKMKYIIGGFAALGFGLAAAWLAEFVGRNDGWTRISDRRA
jgi:hypothetical protein